VVSGGGDADAALVMGMARARRGAGARARREATAIVPVDSAHAWELISRDRYDGPALHARFEV